MGRLTEKTVLVTGSTGAIGIAICKALATEGAKVLAHYGRNVKTAEALVAEIGSGAVCLQADLASPAAVSKLWEEAEQFGPIYGLVNNAGILSKVAVNDLLDDWRSVWAREMQVNFFSAVDLSRYAVLHFRKHGGGRIVNMASRSGQRGYHSNSMPYGASKSALINFTKSIAQSFGAEGIGAVAIAPGWVRTEMTAAIVAEHGEAYALSGIPIGRMAEPQEIGELVTFALFPSQVSLTGAVLDVNGASYLR